MTGNPISRKRFLGKVAAAGMGAGVLFRAPASVWSQPLGASDDIRVAIVGLNNQGAYHANGFRELPGVRVVALCEVDGAILQREVRKFEDRNEKVTAYQDVRRLLEDDTVDALVVAAPNHWHALMTIWACQAGKDVYVEKPVSHCVREGRLMVDAARKYNRVIQSGTQRRSDLGRREAYEWLWEGNLGKIQVVRGLCYSHRQGIEMAVGPQVPPSSVDYDLWTGPAPLRPMNRAKLHYDWHWFWDTGNGEMGNNGIHAADLCCWVAKADKVAPRTLSVGGRFAYGDSAQTPNTHFIYHDYPEVPIILEIMNLPMEAGMQAAPHYRGLRFGCVVYCEGGYVAGGWAYDRDGERIRQFPLDDGAGHRANFIDAVRARDPGLLNADVEKGHVASALCHTGNISHRLGVVASPDEIRERMGDLPQAAETLNRFQEHLAANQLDATSAPFTLGPWLQMDPDREVFTASSAGDRWLDAANGLLADTYRAPYTLPEVL